MAMPAAEASIGGATTSRRRSRLVIAALLATAVVVAGAAAVALGGRGPSPQTAIEIVIRYSKFEPSAITVPVGVPVTITLRNDDPIDHEWIVGDEELHAVHRVGTEPLHPSRPTEVVIPALTSTSTTVTFEKTGQLAFICHLPLHESYGMVGTVTIR
jgi:plastocyanin